MIVDPAFVDTSQGPGTVTYIVEARDEFSAVRGSIVIEGPGGIWRTVDIPVGTFSDRLPVAVPESSPSGRYRPVSVTLEDTAGNAVTLDRGQIELADELANAEFGLESAPDFDVYAGPDTTPPTLEGLSISPESVDTSSGTANVDYSLRASDDLSGIRNVWTFFRHGSAGFSSGPRAPVKDGVWKGRIMLPAHASEGAYRLEEVALTDHAGNTVFYDHDDLAGMGLPAQFDETGPGDSAPPQIVDFRIDSRQISTANGQQRLRWRMRVRDDLSGLGSWSEKANSQVGFSFKKPGEPNEFSWGEYAPELVSGDDLEGEWAGETELPADAPIGTYSVINVYASDRAGNTTEIKGTELGAEPWDLSFENVR